MSVGLLPAQEELLLLTEAAADRPTKVALEVMVWWWCGVPGAGIGPGFYLS